MGNILNIINSDEHFYNLSEDCKQNYMECLDGPFMSKEVKQHFTLTIVNVNSINENKKYIYPIECRTVDAVFSGINHLPEKIVELVNKDRCKVIFSYESEGDFPIENFNEWFYMSKFILKEKVKLSNLYIFCNDFNAEQRNNTEINFFPSTHFLDTISYQLNEMVQDKSLGIELNDFDYDFKIRNISDINIEKKNKKFLCYLRNCARPHRVGIASYFEYNKLWEDNNISFLKVTYQNDECQYLPDYLKDSQKLLHNKDLIELDTQHLKSKMGFETIFSSDWKHYQETFLSIVSETCFDNDSIYFSEKTIKPLLHMHPFIMMSTPYTLQKLNELGFKTFDGFIDEGYDRIKQTKERFEMILREIDKFNNKSFEELKNWWTDILPILEHNQKRLLELGQQKTKKIKLLEKIND
jgi:hypothetical protein